MDTASAYSSNGGWFLGPAATGVLAGIALSTAMTGTTVNGPGVERILGQRQQSNTLKAYVATPRQIDILVLPRSPGEDLALIRNVLKPAVSDLATSLGVSRQAVYNWLNGEAVTQANAISKLKDLAKATNVLTQAGVTINAALLKRKFFHGKTLMQVVQAGESASDAAQLMVHIHQREVAQRERISAQFANRKNTPATADFDLPEANDLSEEDA